MKAAITKGAMLAASLLLCGAHARLAPTAAGLAAQSRAGPNNASQDSQTQAVFRERCAQCHGMDGRGRTSMGEMLEAPDFTDAEWQKGVTDERMRDSVSDGRGEMPAFARKLSPREIAYLVAYVRGFARSDREAAQFRKASLSTTTTVPFVGRPTSGPSSKTRRRT